MTELNPELVRIWEQVSPKELVQRSPAHLLFECDEQLRASIQERLHPKNPKMKFIVSHWFPFKLGDEIKVPGINVDVQPAERPIYYLELTAAELGPKLMELSKTYDVMLININGDQPCICLDHRGRRFRQR